MNSNQLMGKEEDAIETREEQKKRGMGLGDNGNGANYVTKSFRFFV